MTMNKYFRIIIWQLYVLMIFAELLHDALNLLICAKNGESQTRMGNNHYLCKKR